MLDNKFTTEDKERFVDFLNKVAKHAEFKFNTTEMIEYYKVLAHMQTVILPKLDANILEVIKIHEAEESTAEETKE